MQLPYLNDTHKADIRLAASQLSGPTRRAFQADEIGLKYYEGNAR